MNWFSSVFGRKAQERPAVLDRESLDARLRAAYEETAKGNLPEAERQYRDLLERDPRDADALYFLSGPVAHSAILLGLFLLAFR